MPYEPIHHKYRPQTFKDLVGQKTIALTLNNALKQEKIAPAYLFTGPRGTGKTSSARILAKSLNCLTSNQPTPEPCGQCEVCLAIANGSALDVMEIDAASNTGVDNIREIIERSRFAPVRCRYKIYAIDECHMLSTAAFNALLKTLEEPPPQVVFILATTDPQRVLPTIISRCQRFDFRRIPLPEMVEHLKYIAREEKIAIADDALTLIAQIANGGLRDAESLLDQLSLLPDTISVAKVWDLVGAVPEQDLLKLLHTINSNDSLGILQQCRSLLDRGREPLVVLQNLASFYLNLLIAKTAPHGSDLVAVTETCWQQLCREAINWDTALILHGQQHLKEAEAQLRHTTQPRLWLEVTLLGLLPEAHQTITSQPNQETNLASPSRTEINQEQPTQTTSKIARQPSQLPEKQKEIASQPIVTPESIPQASPLVSTSVTPSPPPKEQKTVPNPQVTVSNFDVEAIWQQVVSCLHPPTTQALLKQQCHLVSFDGSSAIVGISSVKLQKLHQGKVHNIEQAFAKVVQHKVKVQLEVATTNQNSSLKKNTTPINNFVPDTPQPKLTVSNHSANSPRSASYIESKKIDLPGEKKVVEPTLSNSAVATPPLAHPPSLGKSDLTSSTPIVKPEDSFSNSSQVTIEQQIDSEDDDDNLQKAIALLTQSFEGELVELNNTQEQFSAASADSKTPEETFSLPSRPNAEDYNDDW